MKDIRGLCRVTTLVIAFSGIVLLTSCGGGDDPAPEAAGGGGGGDKPAAAPSSPEPPAKPSREEVKQMGKDRLEKLLQERPFDKQAKIHQIMQDKLGVDMTALPETRPTEPEMKTALLAKAEEVVSIKKEDEAKIMQDARNKYMYLKPGDYAHMHHPREARRNLCGYVSPAKTPGHFIVKCTFGEGKTEARLDQYGYTLYAFDLDKLSRAQQKYVYDNFTKPRNTEIKKFISENADAYYKSQGWIKGKNKMMSAEQYVLVYIEPKLAAEEKAHVDALKAEVMQGLKDEGLL